MVGPFRPLVLSLLSLISRNSPKQSGMVSPELPAPELPDPHSGEYPTSPLSILVALECRNAGRDGLDWQTVLG